MTGPSLSQLLDPPRPVANVSLSGSHAPASQHEDAPSGSRPWAGPSPVAAGSDSSPVQRYVNTAPSANMSASSAAAPSNPPSRASDSNTPSRANKHGGNNLYACRDCGRSYSRPEHLVRHVQTHTLGRRFSCEVCQKSFARKDLLRRHVANHENDSPAKKRRVNSSPGAGRVSQACRPCAVARVKCDESKPCRRCVNRKLECIFSEGASLSAVHHGHIPSNTHGISHESSHSIGEVQVPELVNSSSPASHSQPNSTPSGPVSGAEASSKNTPYSQPASFKPEASQLPTPETVMDPGWYSSKPSGFFISMPLANYFQATTKYLRRLLTKTPVR